MQLAPNSDLNTLAATAELFHVHVNAVNGVFKCKVPEPIKVRKSETKTETSPKHWEWGRETTREATQFRRRLSPLGEIGGNFPEKVAK